MQSRLEKCYSFVKSRLKKCRDVCKSRLEKCNWIFNWLIYSGVCIGEELRRFCWIGKIIKIVSLW